MHRKLKALVGLGTGVVLLGAATLAWAVIPDGAGVIHACYDSQSGQVRIFDSENGTPKGCGKNETAISWNQTGPAGPAGADGADGAQGPTGPEGPAGPAGASVLSGLEVVEETSVSDAETSKEQSVSCPFGKRAIAGGAELLGGSDPGPPFTEVVDPPLPVALTMSRQVPRFPLGLPTGWRARGHETDANGDEWRIRVWAICVEP